MLCYSFCLILNTFVCMTKINTHFLGYLCSSTSWGGLEMNQLKNAIWMNERGHQVSILCKKDSPIWQAAKDSDIKTIEIGTHKKYYDYKAGKKIAFLLDQNCITHLIVRDTRDMSVAVIAKRKASQLIHLSYFMEMQLGVEKKNIFHTIRFRYFDLWSCPLKWLKNQVEKMTFMDKSKVVVIPSGLDLNNFKEIKEKQKVRKELDLPSDKLVFGLIGRFDPHKGQVLLLEALGKIKNKNVCVAFLGEPTKEAGSEYMDLINQTIKKHELEDRVFIRPFRKDISTFFYAIDAFVMASKAETFGMVTIEAMACGTSIIASNAGGSPEIVDFGTYGLLFEPLDTESLAEKMNVIIENRSLFSSQDLKLEAQKYDHHLVCEKVEKALGLVD